MVGADIDRHTVVILTLQTGGNPPSLRNWIQCIRSSIWSTRLIHPEQDIYALGRPLVDWWHIDRGLQRGSIIKLSGAVPPRLVDRAAGAGIGVAEGVIDTLVPSVVVADSSSGRNWIRTV